MTAEKVSAGDTAGTPGRGGGSSIPAASKTTSEEEHDGREKHTGPRTPGEAEGVPADLCGHASMIEAVTSLDEGSPEVMLVGCGGRVGIDVMEALTSSERLRR